MNWIYRPITLQSSTQVEITETYPGSILSSLQKRIGSVSHESSIRNFSDCVSKREARSMIAVEELVNVEDNSVLLQIICTLVVENERLQKVILGLQKRKSKKRHEVKFERKVLSHIQCFIDAAMQDVPPEDANFNAEDQGDVFGNDIENFEKDNILIIGATSENGRAVDFTSSNSGFMIDFGQPQIDAYYEENAVNSSYASQIKGFVEDNVESCKNVIGESLENVKTRTSSYIAKHLKEMLLKPCKPDWRTAHMYEENFRRGIVSCRRLKDLDEMQEAMERFLGWQNMETPVGLKEMIEKKRNELEARKRNSKNGKRFKGQKKRTDRIGKG